MLPKANFFIAVIVEKFLIEIRKSKTDSSVFFKYN